MTLRAELSRLLGLRVTFGDQRLFLKLDKQAARDQRDRSLLRACGPTARSAVGSLVGAQLDRDRFGRLGDGRREAPQRIAHDVACEPNNAD